ncbi:hypothetical protein GCM10025760_09860 [Microbacterium yannicii]|uniref:Uncharacterized protein n=1 Tax=Microbacterium yannicii TaxID=671622 RepID=A0ABP9M2D3_9MICO
MQGVPPDPSQVTTPIRSCRPFENAATRPAARWDREIDAQAGRDSVRPMTHATRSDDPQAKVAALELVPHMGDKVWLPWV